MIELKNIDKYYNIGTVNEICLFKDFNLKIQNGDFVSVIGRKDPSAWAVRISQSRRSLSAKERSEEFIRTRPWEPVLP